MRNAERYRAIKELDYKKLRNILMLYTIGTFHKPANSISRLTQCEFFDFGEQKTTIATEFSIASSIAISQTGVPVPVQRFLDTKVNSAMETFRLADQIIHQPFACTAGGVNPGFVL